MRKRVVVTGLGVAAPNAHGLDNFEKAIREGLSGIRFQPLLEELKFGCQIAGIPEDFDAIRKQYFDHEKLMSINDNIGYASVSAVDAWTDAGFSVPDGNDDNVDWDTGVIAGSGIGGMDTIAQSVVPTINEGRVRRLGSRIVEQVMMSGTSARIGGLLGAGNQVTSNSSACSTGNEAIIDALWRIRMGLAKRMVAGGSEGASPYIWGGFDAMRVIARKYNDQPASGSRPMSASACGFVPGSGGAMLILEELETALARGARIYAEIIGGYRQLRRPANGRFDDRAQSCRGAKVHPGRRGGCGNRFFQSGCHQRAFDGNLRRSARSEKLGGSARANAGQFPVYQFHQVNGWPLSGRGGRHRMRCGRAAGLQRVFASFHQL